MEPLAKEIKAAAHLSPLRAQQEVAVVQVRKGQHLPSPKLAE
jgi:hypothetical protein